MRLGNNTRCKAKLDEHYPIYGTECHFQVLTDHFTVGSRAVNNGEHEHKRTQEA